MKFKWLLAYRPIVETVACSFGLIAVAVYFQSLWPLFWVGCTAPLFLQSDQSTALAARIFQKISEQTSLPFDEMPQRLVVIRRTRRRRSSVDSTHRPVLALEG